MPRIDELHFLAVGDDGDYSSSGVYQSSLQQVEKIVAHLRQQNIQELTLYFHGGLVNESTAESGIVNVMEALADRQKPHADVLSFIWKTGFLETVRDNVDEIFRTKFGRSLLKWAIRAVTKRLKIDFTKSPVNDGLSLSAIEAEFEYAAREGKVPFEELDVDLGVKAKGSAMGTMGEDDPELNMMIQAELEGLYRFDSDAFSRDWNELPSSVSVDAELEQLFDESAPGAKGIFTLKKLATAIVKISVRVVKRYIDHRDHGLQATVVEEICRAYFVSDAGQWVWGNMKTKAAELWQKPGCVGFDFMERLQQELPQLRLNLVGHSAGSIAICELLKRRRERSWSMTVDRICWWAPACRADLFVEQVIAHQGDFNSFRMVTMRDNYELKDALVDRLPWLYPSSLLYFISGVLEEQVDAPIAGMQRYHRESGPYRGELFAELEKFLSVPDRIVLSETDNAEPGFESHAIDHGAFNEDPKTRESLTVYLG